MNGWLSQADVSAFYRRFVLVRPEILHLGCAVAAWPYIPYPLLRACRRLIDPRTPTYVEADLCGSPLVESCATDGFSLEPRFRITALRFLRQACRNDTIDQGCRQELTRLRNSLAAWALHLSPLLKIEAELAWDYVLLDEDAFNSRAEELLRDILFTAVLERRTGIFSWVAGASARLPSDCVRGEAAWLLNQLCAAHDISMVPVTTPAAVTPTGLMALVLEHLPTIVIGIDRRPGFIEFGSTTQNRSVGVVVVATDPLFVFVRDRGTAGEPVEQRVSLRMGQTSRVNCSDGEITLGNLLGQTFTLAPLEGERSRESKAADAVIARAEVEFKKRTSLHATVIRTVDSGYVVSLDEIGATALLRATFQELFEGDQITVTIQHVDRERRWISVGQNQQLPDYRGRRVKIRIQRRFIHNHDVHPGYKCYATVLHHGDKKYGYRSAHVLIHPRSLLAGVSTDTRSGVLRFGGAIRRTQEGTWVPEKGATVELEVTRRTDKHWEIQLCGDSQAPDQLPPVQALHFGSTLVAIVTVVELRGAQAEGPTGELLWLPRNEVLPQPRPDEPPDLQVGEAIQVRILRCSQRYPDRFLVSQRAVAEPFLNHLYVGRELTGEIEHQQEDSEFLVRLGPLPEVSSKPFQVTTTGARTMSLRPLQRVRVRVAEFDRSRWIVLVRVLGPA